MIERYLTTYHSKQSNYGGKKLISNNKRKMLIGERYVNKIWIPGIIFI